MDPPLLAELQVSSQMTYAPHDLKLLWLITYYQIQL